MSDTSRTGLATGVTLRAVSRTALGCLLGAVLLVAGTAARAGDDDDSDKNEMIDTKIIRGIMEGLGLQRDGGASINYEERAPLVIPPSRTLPPPETDAAAKNPNWPVDPDVKRAREARAAEHVYKNTDEDVEGRPMRPSELNVGKRKNSARDATTMTPEQSGNPLSPTQLGYKGGLWNSLFGKAEDQNAQFIGEPPRASLTDPPAGYQTPSPNEPYGKAKAGAPKAFDYKNERGIQEQ